MKYTHISAIIMLIFILAVTALFGYWLFIQPDIMTFPTLVFSTDKTSYHQGDYIKYTFTYCKSRQDVATVNRVLVDGYLLNFSSIQSNLPTGCHTVTTSDIQIPNFIPNTSDTYHIEGTAVYPINPLRNQYVYFKTTDFEIK